MEATYMTILKATVSKVKGANLYYGRVRVYENGRFCYSDAIQIHRLTRKDALEDAKAEIRDMLQLNSWNEVAAA